MILRDAEISEKRAKLRASLATGKPLDPSIANDQQLRKDYAYDESRPDRTANEELDLDDEYSQLSGIVDPRVLVTTSRDPSSRLAAFAKEIRLLLPGRYNHDSTGSRAVQTHTLTVLQYVWQLRTLYAIRPRLGDCVIRHLHMVPSADLRRRVDCDTIKSRKPRSPRAHTFSQSCWPQ